MADSDSVQDEGLIRANGTGTVGLSVINRVIGAGLLAAALLAGCGSEESPAASAENTQPVAYPNVDDSFLSSAEWRFVGPYRGGRVLAVAGALDDPLKFYFGAAHGGVWKTTDALNVRLGILRDHESDFYQWFHFRVPSAYDGESLSWSITPELDSIYFAYFVPYSVERHLDLIADCSTSPLVKSHVLGHTLDGQDLDMLEIGDGAEGNCAPMPAVPV
jgi:hypothetical protein